MKMYLNKLRYWFPYYLYKELFAREKGGSNEPIHLFLCVVDHFEPFNGPVDYKKALERVLVWKKRYPEFALRHRDVNNYPLKHTWFYPPHTDHRVLPYLVELCQEGFGDIEMHLHHNHMNPFPDTPETLRTKILTCIDDYGKYGIFCQPDSVPRFAFIHGDWSLDNSGGCELCGVNNELTILRECGCFADYTFPCLTRSQPAMVNTIYYAIDDPDKPKSYNWGTPVVAGRKSPHNSLMIIQGIMGLRSDRKKKLKIAIEYSDLDSDDPPTPERIDFWVKNSIIIQGKTNWRFIKLHTHGGREIRWDANFGKAAEIAFNYLERNYNDGIKYILHYVTAREMYNIIKAAEDEKTGCSTIYKDYEIKPYLYRN